MVDVSLHDSLLRLQCCRQPIESQPSRELGFQMSPFSAFCSKFSKTDSRAKWDSKHSSAWMRNDSETKDDSATKTG